MEMEYGKLTVAEEMNSLLEKSMFTGDDGSLKPFVCITCDKFLKATEIRYLKKEDLLNCKDMLIPKRVLHRDVLKYYTYEGEQCMDLQDLLLSRKGCYVKRGKNDCFIVCDMCRKCIKVKHLTPQYAISNYFEIGVAPKEILELTDVELAFLSSVRSHMHVLTFRGGHKGIKGWHCMLKTSMTDKARVLEGMESIRKVPNTVAVVLYGPMTEAQRNRIIGISRIRRDLCFRAFKWLLKNHDYYKTHVKLEEFDSGGGVIVVDKSTDIESKKTNIESTFEVRVVFPDATLDCSNGGVSTMEKLNESMRERFCGGNVEAHVRLSKSEFVKDFEGSNFMLAFLKQYPYGYGGLNVKRTIAENGRSRKLYCDEYFGHVTNISNLCFHEGMFTLVAFNMFFRTKMMQTACWKIRVNSKLGERISNANVTDTLTDIRKECQKGLNRMRESVHNVESDGRAFLKVVSAMSSTLPHTSEAAWKGRSSLFSMQVCLGMGHVFFTASPTEDNSAIILVHAGMNDGLKETDLSYKNVMERSKQRAEIAFTYPGLSTLNFEVVLRILIRCIIGWNNEAGGWFGKPLAYFYSVEEQSRKMLHAHFVLWLSDGHPVRVSDLGNPTIGSRRKKRLESELVKYVEAVESCSIFGNRIPVLHHECSRKGKTRCPEVKGLQSLRNLRHREGCRKEKMTVFLCPDCEKEWSSTEAALTFAIHSNPSLSTEYRISMDQSNDLKGVGYENYLRKVCEEVVFQNRYPGGMMADRGLICNALYNIHASRHVKTCFSETRPECRYRFPKKANEKTRIDYKEMDEFYDMNGILRTRNAVSIVRRRGPADIFSNTFCAGVSKSKVACNTNVATIVNPRMSFYVTKYVSKDTAAEDASDYMKMTKFLSKRCLSKRFENSRSESLSRVIGSCLAHTSENVVSAPMAKYLINNGSRFGQSHEIQYVPLKQLKNWIQQKFSVLQISPGNPSESTQQTNRCNSDVSFCMESSALNYLLRPSELEDISAYTFYSEYITCGKRKSKNCNEMLEFGKDHPGSSTRCVKKRVLPVLPGINNYHFVDTKHLSGDLLDLRTITGPVDEDYACTVLLLFCPFRTNSDLQIASSYVTKYQQVYPEIVEPNCRILENIQNIRNGCRKSFTEDDLEEDTEIFVEEDSRSRNDDMGINEDNNCCEYERSFMELLFDEGSEEMTCDSMLDIAEKGEPIHAVAFDEIRSRGSCKCGFSRLSPCSALNGNDAAGFVDFDTSDGHSNGVCRKRKLDSDEKDEPTLVHIAGVLSLSVTSRNVGRQSRTVKMNESDDTVRNSETRGSDGTMESIDDERSDREKIYATGSAESIIKWSERQEWNGSSYEVLDDDQKHAFILICAHFVIGYIEKAETTELCSSLQHAECIGGLQHVLHSKSIVRVKSVELRKLLVVKGALRLFLDGPGGSGKSRIIQEVMAYCREFCMMMNTTFSKYTINVTASTGVAATMINGETVHSALGLEKKSIAPDEIAAFGDVRMLIIDEISMISQCTLARIERQLRRLRNPDEYYGGVSVIFIGDFRQLKPIGASKQGDGSNPTIYDDEDFCEWFDAINVYIPLKGRYRFSDDLKWGGILERLRNGCLLPEDIGIINERVVDEVTLTTKDGQRMPEGIRYCTAGNLERDSINTGLFEHRVGLTGGEDSLLVFSDSLAIQTDKKEKKYKELVDANHFYQQCSENDCKFQGKRSTRIDPVLKVYPGCPVMLTDNLDVQNGLANGTEATVSKVLLKKGTSLRTMKIADTDVKLVNASEISKVELKSKTATEGTFYLTPRKFNFTASFPHPVGVATRRNSKFTRNMTACQLPFIHNSATTAHKLQGSSCQNLYINGFSYRPNWAYVALSRVKTLNGLFLREPLSFDADFSVDKGLLKMNKIFSTNKKLPTSFLRAVRHMGTK